MDIVKYPGLALAAAAAYKGYKLFEVPKGLEEVSEVSVMGLVASFFRGEAFDEQFERLIRPALAKNGCARIWMRGQWDVVITNPKLSREVLANSEAYTKAPEGGNVMLRGTLAGQFFGESSIGGSDGEEWRRHRKAANPVFKKQFEPALFGECMADLFENIQENQPMMIHDQFQRLTLDALGKGIFSYNFEALKKGDSNHYLKLYNDINKIIFNPLYFMFPFLDKWVPSRIDGRAKNQAFRAFLAEVIQKRKAQLQNGTTANDLMSLMIKETIEEEGCLSDEEVLNNIIVFFLAGHDTTANTLTTILYYLSKHQHIQDRARKEVLDLTDSCPTVEMTKSMDYINCIIKESMRIVTTATQLRRYCRKSLALGDDILVPEGCNVVIHSWAIHHDPDVFPDPDTFNPDRFADPRGSQSQAWMAFGSGSRMCIGMNFSLVEQRTVLAMLLQKYSFTLGPHAKSQGSPKLNGTGLARLVDIDVIFTPRT